MYCNVLLYYCNVCSNVLSSYTVVMYCNVLYHCNVCSNVLSSYTAASIVLSSLSLSAPSDHVEYSQFLNGCQCLTVTLLTANCFMHTAIRQCDETKISPQSWMSSYLRTKRKRIRNCSTFHVDTKLLLLIQISWPSICQIFEMCSHIMF